LIAIASACRLSRVEGAQADPGAVIRKATADDVPRLARALARAFYDDPVFNWLVPDDSERMRRSERGFAFYLRRVYLPHDECYAAQGGAGGALWLPPGKWHLGPLAQLQLVPGMVAAMGPRLPQLLRAIGTIESNHPHKPHYYLPFVGVEPELQGKGVGTALLAPILHRCDRGAHTRLPGGHQPAQPGVLPAAGIRGHRRVPISEGWPAILADVA
jgi:ribosomal protein S18 acetylase RimI-like enzyme